MSSPHLQDSPSAAFAEGGADDGDESTTTRAPPPPASGVRRSRPAPCLLGLRHLARNAEWLCLEALAFELFFAAVRIESTGEVGLVRADLEEISTFVTDTEARFYRRAVRMLTGMSSAR